jgi:NADH-quinone oxidoreductase subunit I
MPHVKAIDPRDVKDVSLPDLAGKRSFWVRTYIPAILSGMRVTMRHLARNLRNRRNTATIEYPEVKRAYGPRHRGRHYLKKRPDGDPRCVACYMCATACPADCIFIVAGEHPDPAIEKYPVEFVIDGLRCIYCGYCVDACPEDAIAMTRDYELASYHREDFIWDKEYLLNWRDRVPREDGYQPYEGEIDKELMSRGRL